MNKLTVAAYIDARDPRSYSKQIRVLDHRTHKYLGVWYAPENVNRLVREVKITQRQLFIFV